MLAEDPLGRGQMGVANYCAPRSKKTQSLLDEKTQRGKSRRWYFKATNSSKRPHLGDPALPSHLVHWEERVVVDGESRDSLENSKGFLLIFFTFKKYFIAFFMTKIK